VNLVAGILAPPTAVGKTHHDMIDSRASARTSAQME